MKSSDVMNGLSDELAGINSDLERIAGMTDEEVCREFNTDSREDILETLEWEKQRLEEELEQAAEYLRMEQEGDGMDYVSLQLSQGLPVIYW